MSRCKADVHCCWYRCCTAKVSKVCLGIPDSLGAIYHPSACQSALSFRVRKVQRVCFSAKLRGAKSGSETVVVVVVGGGTTVQPEDFNYEGISIHEPVLRSFFFFPTSSFLNRAWLSALALGHHKSEWRGFQRKNSWVTLPHLKPSQVDSP